MSIVSIIMPVRNTALFLEECLDSIIAQSYDNWELLAVDDHSTDRSYEILSDYKDNRIVVLRNKGKGIIPALQTGYAASVGEYITRMDSDDYMSSDKLELMCGALDNAGAGHLVVGLVKYFSDNKIGEGYLHYQDWLNAMTLEASNYSDIYKECSIPSPNWLCLRSDFEKVGAFAGELYPEDYDLAFRFRTAKLQITPVTRITHYWRDHSSRSSRTDPNYADNKFIAIKLKHFLNADRDTNRKLIIWGGGKKGKAIAKYLSDQKIKFTWICNNPNKVGHQIYGIIMQSVELISTYNSSQIIIAISQPAALPAIAAIKSQNPVHSYFHFC